MTKNLGFDYDGSRENKGKRSRFLPWLFDLMVPIVLAALAVTIGRYGWPF